MQEIKVRAFDKGEDNSVSRMLYSDQSTPSDVWFSLDDGKVQCMINYDYCDSFGDEHDNWVALDNIMEFTGLTKNGKDVYTGDIIKELFGKTVGVIKRGIYRSCFDNTETQHCGFYVEWPDRCYHRKDLGFWINMVDAEIVGNIYENPEILTEQETET